MVHNVFLSETFVCICGGSIVNTNCLLHNTSSIKELNKSNYV